MHAGLVDAVCKMGWTSGAVAPNAEADITATADALADLDHTTREALVEARLKQGEFRRRLVEMWGSCAVTGCGILEALTASHIKPWRDCNNRERLDVHNGLLLLGTLDRLFDAGLITFDSDGTLRPSNQLSRKDQRALGLRQGMCLRRVDDAHLPFLRWHRNRVFSGEAAEQGQAVGGARRRH
jgi:predicted restriction endonuclease